MGVVEETLGGSSVVRDHRALEFEFVPEELPGREDVMAELSRLFRIVANGEGSQRVSITGPVGCGKTAVSRRFATEIRDAMQKRGRKLTSAYVNCRNDRTDGLVLGRILRRLDEGFPDRGFSPPEMLGALRKLVEKHQTHLLVILDEVDTLLREPTDLLYNLSRFETGGDTRISVIAVSQRDIFDKLDEATRSTFKQSNRIVMAGYTQEPMRRIVDQRVHLAFHPGTVKPDVAELVADVATERGGNARTAVEILGKAAGKTDAENDELVRPDYVRAAVDTLTGGIPDFKLEELPLHEKLVLLAVARKLKKMDEAFVITGELQKAYAVLCEEYDETARGHTQFWKYVNALASYGFIHVKKSSKGQPGTTSYISLPDVPAGKLEERLVAYVASEKK